MDQSQSRADPLHEAPCRRDDELKSFKNVVLSPHIGGSPRFDALDDIAEMIMDLAGAVPR